MIKKVLNIFFITIILLTIIFAFAVFIILVSSEPTDDIFGNSMDGFISLLITSAVVLVEFNIYRCSVYFLAEKKKVWWKTIFNIVMIIATLILIFAVISLFYDFGLLIPYKLNGMLWIIDGAVLLILRFIYFCLWVGDFIRQDTDISEQSSS